MEKKKRPSNKLAGDLEKILELAKKYKVSKIKAGDYEIEMSPVAFAISVDDLKEVAEKINKENDDDDDILFHSS